MKSYCAYPWVWLLSLRLIVLKSIHGMVCVGSTFLFLFLFLHWPIDLAQQGLSREGQGLALGWSREWPGQSAFIGLTHSLMGSQTSSNQLVI